MPTEHGLEGTVELSVVESVDSAGYRAVVRSWDSGGRQSCVINPSPYMGIIPEKDTVVLTYKKQGWYSRYLMPIANLTDSSDKTTDQKFEKGEERLGEIVRGLEPGDCFFGRYSRLLMDNVGNARLYSKGGNLGLTLNHSTSKTELYGTNFSVFTPGNGIRIRSVSSIPTTFGDTIRIEKNVPLPLIPEEVLPTPPLPTNIALFEIDEIGGITLEAVKTSPVTPTASLELSPVSDPGNVRLRNLLAFLTFSSTGDVDLFGPKASLELGATGSVVLTGGPGTGSFTASQTGQVNLASTADMLLNAGINLTVLAKTMVVQATPGPISLTATTKIDLLAPVVNFFGLPATIPLIAVTTLAKIPVTVNGVLVGFLPVIP